MFSEELLRRATGTLPSHIFEQLLKSLVISIDSKELTMISSIFSGENNIVIVKGANDCLLEDNIHSILPSIQSSSIVLFQLEIDLDVTLQALRLVKQAGG